MFEMRAVACLVVALAVLALAGRSAGVRSGKEWDDLMRDIKEEEAKEKRERAERMERERREKMSQNPFSSQSVMIFVNLRESVSGRKRTHSIGLGWQTSLKLAGMEAVFYAIEDRRLIATLWDGSRKLELQSFLLQQPEVANIEVDQKKITPEDAAKNPAPQVDMEQIKRMIAEQQRKEAAKKDKKEL